MRVCGLSHDLTLTCECVEGGIRQARSLVRNAVHCCTHCSAFARTVALDSGTSTGQYLYIFISLACKTRGCLLGIKIDCHNQTTYMQGLALGYCRNGGS